MINGVKGIILDMDGTITLPVIDFQKMRNALEIYESGDILEIIKNMPEEKQQHVSKVIEHYEQYAIDNMTLQTGFLEFYGYCCEYDIKLALITRNRIRNVNALLNKFDLHFDHIVTRDFDFVKPAPEPALHVLSLWKFSPDECFFVGDYIHDISCGRNAGMKTCFMKNDGYEDFSNESDFSIANFFELLNIIE
ncbi:MAG: HAD-IA family hydrolase [Kiritimatiellae bacterium]|nr:HAD-IA family hydrolase [Kiritimatiellia bacterium]